MDWEPTMNLRFVERRVETSLDAFTTVEKTVRVLQQEWVLVRDSRRNWSTPAKTEWRDVPLAEEGEDE